MDRIEMDKVTQFLSSHSSELSDRIVVRKSFQAVEDIVLKRELLERLIERPQSLLDRFAHAHEHSAHVRPFSANGDLEKSADDTSCVLRHVSGVGDEREVFDIDLGDVALEKDVDFPLAGDLPSTLASDLSLAGLALAGNLLLTGIGTDALANRHFR